MITRSDGLTFLTEFEIIRGATPAETPATAAVAPVYSYHKTIDVTLGDATVRVDVRNDDGVYTMTSHDTALEFRSPVKGVSDNSVISIDSDDQDPFISMIAARASGDISIFASTDAKSLGLEAGSFRFRTDRHWPKSAFLQCRGSGREFGRSGIARSGVVHG